MYSIQTWPLDVSKDSAHIHSYLPSILHILSAGGQIHTVGNLTVTEEERPISSTTYLSWGFFSDELVGMF